MVEPGAFYLAYRMFFRINSKRLWHEELGMFQGNWAILQPIGAPPARD